MQKSTGGFFTRRLDSIEIDLPVPAMYLASAFGANLAIWAFCEINNLRRLNIRRESESHPLRHSFWFDFFWLAAALFLFTFDVPFRFEKTLERNAAPERRGRRTRRESCDWVKRRLSGSQKLAQGQESCWREDRQTGVREVERAGAGRRKPVRLSHSIPSRQRRCSSAFRASR